MKTIHFMAGLPRSGATLLSALLNQNPAIYASPQTDLIWQMNLLYNNMLDSETYRLGQLKDGYDNVVKQLPQNFYKHIDKPIIIDKNRSWGVANYYKLAQMITPNAKVITLYRPLFEVLASFIRQCETNSGNNYIDKAIIQNNYVQKYGSVNNARCEWLLENELSYNLESLRQAKHGEYKDNFLLLKYDDLVGSTQKTLSNIYSFLNINEFHHELLNIDNNETYADLDVYGLSELHSVRKHIQKNQYDFTDYVSDYIINKYKESNEGTL